MCLRTHKEASLALKRRGKLNFAYRRLREEEKGFTAQEVETLRTTLACRCNEQTSRTNDTNPSFLHLSKEGRKNSCTTHSLERSDALRKVSTRQKEKRKKTSERQNGNISSNQSIVQSTKCYWIENRERSGGKIFIAARGLLALELLSTFFSFSPFFRPPFSSLLADLNRIKWESQQPTDRNH